MEIATSMEGRGAVFSKKMQYSYIAHCAQRGSGRQVTRPCSHNPICSGKMSSPGMRRCRIACARSGVALAGIQPNRMVTRNTWVSTGTTGRCRENIQTIAALFTPTPVKLCR